MFPSPCHGDPNITAGVMGWELATKKKKKGECMYVAYACVESWTGISGGMGVGESLKEKNRLSDRPW